MHHSLSFPSHFAVSEWNMTTLWVSWTQRDLQEVFKGSAMITENKGDGLEKAHVGASKWSVDASLSPPTIFFASLGERRPVSTCPKCRRFCAPSARLTFQTASKSKRPRRGAPPPFQHFPCRGSNMRRTRSFFLSGGVLLSAWSQSHGRLYWIFTKFHRIDGSWPRRTEFSQFYFEASIGNCSGGA